MLAPELGCGYEASGIHQACRRRNSGLPLAARAQQAKVYTIGVLALTTPSPEPLLKALRDGLRDAGYVEGRNFAWRYGRAMGGQLPSRKTPPSWSVSRSTSSSRSSRQPRWRRSRQRAKFQS